MSVRFDRASEYYDRTRSLSTMAMAGLIGQIVPEVKDLGRCLEIGVGTGRFAVPLNDAGVQMWGIDLSRPMLDKLVEKSGGEPPFPLCEGDATLLPYEQGAFGSVIAVHVFHLIERWTDAVDEAFRVARPGGKLLVDFGGFGTGTWNELNEVFADAAGLSLDFVGAQDEDQLIEAVVERGARARRFEPVQDVKRLPYRALVKLFEEGAFSFTWSASAERRRVGADAVRAELTKRQLRLDDMLEHEREVVWTVFDLPD